MGSREAVRYPHGAMGRDREYRLAVAAAFGPLRPASIRGTRLAPAKSESRANGRGPEQVQADVAVRLVRSRGMQATVCRVRSAGAQP
jgi:hypothetical protein